MVRSRSRNSLSDPQQLGQSVLSEPPRDRWDVDAIEQWQIWIDSGGVTTPLKARADKDLTGLW